MNLTLAPGLTMPADVVTRRMAVLAMSGAGKSNAAVVLAEEMHRAGLPWVAIDPKGDWWGVRANAAGNPGLSIPVFGGLKGDAPLERTGGRLMGELIADERMACVLDVSEFDTRQHQFTFLADLAETLLKRNRDPLHLFLEEADEYLPQKPVEKGELPRCLGAWQRLVKRGRFRGLGCTLISQRPAAVSKDVLNMAEALIVLRTAAPRDRKAIEEWVETHDATSRDLVRSLPSLNDGEAWVWSPQWLKVMKRVQLRRRQTFDSGETPKGGRIRPATMADVDLVKITARMSATIERAKADDPKVLRARIAQLEKDLKAKAVPPPALVPERVEVPVLDGANAELFIAWLRGLGQVAGAIDGFRADIKAHGLQVEGWLQKLAQTGRSASETRRSLPAPVSPSRHDRPLRVVEGPGDPEVGKGGLRRILIALAQRAGLSARQIGVRAGLSSSSGSFSNYLSRARTAGWIEGSRDRMNVTDAGLVALGEFEPLPTGPELLEHWLSELGQSGAAKILRALAEAYPDKVTKEDLGHATGLSHTSGSFSNYLSKLRTLELISGGRELVASEELFA